MKNVTEKEFQELVNQYYRGELDITMSELMDNYNIVLDIQPNHTNEDINNLINNFCTNVSEKDDSVTFKGLAPNNYLNFNRYLSSNFQPMHEAFNGYREAYFSNNDLVSVETVEGDIYITIFHTVEAYNDDMRKSLEFYKEN